MPQKSQEMIAGVLATVAALIFPQRLGAESDNVELRRSRYCQGQQNKSPIEERQKVARSAAEIILKQRITETIKRNDPWLRFDNDSISYLEGCDWNYVGIVRVVNQLGVALCNSQFSIRVRYVPDENNWQFVRGNLPPCFSSQ